MKLGIFDSGIGGKAVAEALQHTFPAAEIIRVDDHENVPYGDKSLENVRKLTDIAIRPLREQHCDIIILGCNTATAAAIEFLRDHYPKQQFIGLEPMVKPAAEQTKTGVIAICATPATLSSERYQNLKHAYGHGITILEPDCSDWARMIEDDELDELIIRNTIKGILAENADIIVLACTHYHWIRQLIEQTASGRAQILDPSAAIAKRVKHIAQTITTR